MRKEIIVNEVVNIAEDGEITLLDGFFKYDDNFKGATGSTFYPVSKSYYRQQTTLKSIIERLKDSVRESEIPRQYGTYNKWAKAIKEADEAESFAFDTSYRELWDYLRKECNLNENNAYIFECTGGGRCFNKNFTGNKNERLHKWIRKFETECNN